jgi:hypothetical protein
MTDIPPTMARDGVCGAGGEFSGTRRRDSLRTICPLLLAVLVCTVFPRPSWSQEDGELAQRFRDEAPRKWKEYRAFAERLQGSVTVAIIRNDRMIGNYRREIKQNASCKLMLRQSLLPESPGGELSAYNPTYGFSLKRRREDQSWAVSGVELEEARIRKAHQVLEDGSNPACELLQLWTEDLSELTRKSSFAVRRAIPAHRDGVELVQIDFDNTHPIEPSGEEPFCPIQSGIMFLDPNHFWCLRAWDLQLKYNRSEPKNTAAIEYRDRSAEYSIPKRIRIEHMDPRDPPKSSTWVRDFDFEEPASLPADSEFTLTAFGLPEPFGAEPRGSLWYLWAAGAGFVCLGLGFFIRRRSQQSA